MKSSKEKIHGVFIISGVVECRIVCLEFVIAKGLSCEFVIDSSSRLGWGLRDSENSLTSTLWCKKRTSHLFSLWVCYNTGADLWAGFWSITPRCSFIGGVGAAEVCLIRESGLAYIILGGSQACKTISGGG